MISHFKSTHLSEQSLSEKINSQMLIKQIYINNNPEVFW